ncbi:MAG: glutamate--cysteine ligase, partial [Acidovorax soli]|nr:glutamate--cysteine ligase [Acidovorax soli]
GNSFTGFSTQQSALARDALLALPWSAAQQARFAALADESVAAQKAIEAADTLPFEEWRQHYMAAQGLG